MIPPLLVGMVGGSRGKAGRPLRNGNFPKAWQNVTGTLCHKKGRADVHSALRAARKRSFG